MKKYTLLSLICLLIFSCRPEEDPISGNPDPEINNPDPGVDTTVVVGDENWITGKSKYIFDQEKLHTFELNLSPADLEKINSNPAAEEYVEGTVTFEGETVGPVGIRYKGSIGAFVNCVSGNDWANPSGRKTCTKLSMKVKINWDDPERRFFGLKKLQFHAMNLDDSQMRDRLGYYLFREMGVPAPRSVHARLIINGEYSGIYALVEQIDGRFTRQNFDDGTGNLYKEIWPLQASGQPFSEREYLDALKTNEDEDPTADRIRNFAKSVAEAAPEDLKQVIQDNMLIDEIISYAVVDRAIRNDDGAFHWYCGSGNDCAPHNFFWYEEPTNGTMHLIPWDLDNAFENIIRNVNPVTPIADDWGETRNNCNAFSFGWLFARQRSAACDKLTYGWTLFEDEYAQTLQEFKDDVFSQANTDQMLDKWVEQIRDATLEANQKYGDAISINQWESKVQELKDQLAHARR